MLFPRPISSRLTSFRRSTIPRVVVAPRAALNPAYHRRGYSHSGYGDDQAGPMSESPQQQGASASADLEHPGPPPVSEGQGSGSSPTKGTSEGHNTDSSNSTNGGARPAIHDERGGPKTPSQDGVEQHNQEFQKRRNAEMGSDNGNDKVGKEFWKGHGGADRDP